MQRAGARQRRAVRRVAFSFAPTAEGTYSAAVSARTAAARVALLALQGQGKVADSDRDGLPNAYEVAQDLDVDQPADARFDDDGDGCDTLTEYEAGCDPHNPDSNPTTLILRHSPAVPRVREGGDDFPIIAGHGYIAYAYVSL
jgi:hypothetical protein